MRFDMVEIFLENSRISIVVSVHMLSDALEGIVVKLLAEASLDPACCSCLQWMVRGDVFVTLLGSK
jgi:hypothetical protein